MGTYVLHDLVLKNDLNEIKKLQPSAEDIDATNQDGLTPLHLATYANQTEVALYLINHSGEVNVKDPNETTPLHWSAYHGNAPLIQALLDKNAIGNPDKNKIEPIHLAALNGHTNCIKFMENSLLRPDSGGITPLHLAAHAGRQEVIQLIDKCGIDPNINDQNSIQPIHLAAASNHTDIVSYLISTFADACEQDSSQRIPMHWAASLGNIKMMELLMKDTTGERYRWTDKLGYTPLILATLYGHYEAVVYLLKHEDNVNLEIGDVELLLTNSETIDDVIEKHLDEFDNHNNVLHWACAFGTSKAVKQIIDAGKVDVGTVGDTNNTPLHTAAAYGNCSVIEYLIETGAEINALDEEDAPPLVWAAAHGHQGAVQLLLDKGAELEQKAICWAAACGHLNTVKLLNTAGLNMENDDDDQNDPKSPIIWAAVHKHRHIIQYLLEAFPHLSNTIDLIHWCASTGLIDEVKLLLERGVDVNDCDIHYNRTALHWVAMSGDVEMAKFLLDNGADVNMVEDQGDLPIHYAIERGNIDVLKLLVEKGSDLNRRGDLGCPLCMAARDGKLEIMDILIAAGADMNIAEFDRDTPLNIAMRYGNKNVVNYLLGKNARRTEFLHTTAEYGTTKELAELLDNGMHVDEPNEYGSTPLFYAVRTNNENTEFLISRGANINHRNSIGESPLHVAVQCQSLDVIRVLVANGADINCKGDRDGITPLIRAASYNLEDAFKLLIELGADIELPNDFGETPLMILTVWANRLELIELLFSLNANVNVRDINGKTPLHNTITNNSTALLKMLIKKGVDINAKTNDNRTALSYAVQYSIKENITNIKILLLHGADVNLDRKIIYKCKDESDIQLIDLLINAGLNLTKMELPVFHEHQCTQLQKFIEFWEFQPLSLKQLARIALRKGLGSRYCSIIRKEYLPKSLQEYLLYGLLETC